MSKIRRLLAVALILVMITAMVCVPAGAAADTSGSITINGTTSGAIYKLYKVFEIEVINEAYFYTPTANWEQLFAEGSDGALYGTVVNGYIVWGNQNLFSNDEAAQDTAIAAFANLAQKYANENNIPADVTATSESTSITIENLTNGAYYLVDSSLGATAIAGPVTPDFAINEKNSVSEVPAIMKSVGPDLAEYMSVDMGEEFYFTVTITLNEPVAGGTMTFTDVVPKHIEVTENSLVVTVKSGENTTTLTKDTDYTVAWDAENTASDTSKTTVTHKVEFQRDFTAGDVITLSYKAQLVSNGETLPRAHEMYTNLAKIEYGDKSVSDTASVFTLAVSVWKYYMDDTGVAQNLNGAEFVLKNSEGKYYKLENNSVSWVDSLDEATRKVSEGEGMLSFFGIAAGTYTLVETKAPAGYTGAGEITLVVDRNSEEVQVENIKGTSVILPETGGIGTTIFYIAGAALLVAAAVIIIARKRKGTEG